MRRQKVITFYVKMCQVLQIAKIVTESNSLPCKKIRKNLFEYIFLADIVLKLFCKCIINITNEIMKITKVLQNAILCSSLIMSVVTLETSDSK